MPEPRPPTRKPDPPRATALNSVLELAITYLMNWLTFLRSKTDETRHQLKEAFYSTSDQVLEKAEETRKSVKLRMAILEIEHHLNRLYPQIGKLTCDLHAQGGEQWPQDADLKAKIELAEEYRVRLGELRGDLEEHQQRGRAARNTP